MSDSQFDELSADDLDRLAKFISGLSDRYHQMATDLRSSRVSKFKYRGLKTLKTHLGRLEVSIDQNESNLKKELRKQGLGSPLAGIGQDSESIYRTPAAHTQGKAAKSKSPPPNVKTAKDSKRKASG